MRIFTVVVVVTSLTIVGSTWVYAQQQRKMTHDQLVAMVLEHETKIAEMQAQIDALTKLRGKAPYNPDASLSREKMEKTPTEEEIEEAAKNKKLLKGMTLEQVNQVLGLQPKLLAEGATGEHYVWGVADKNGNITGERIRGIIRDGRLVWYTKYTDRSK